MGDESVGWARRAHLSFRQHVDDITFPSSSPPAYQRGRNTGFTFDLFSLRSFLPLITIFGIRVPELLFLWNFNCIALFKD